MRDYLSLGNFKKAAILGALVSLMAIPRFREGGLHPLFFVFAAFLLMTLAAGAPMAWGKCAGMAGVFPEPRRMWIGIGVAVLIILAALPVHLFLLDPHFLPAIKATGNEQVLTLRYPETFAGRAGLLLWSAGFETLFFTAAAMSFFARLTKRIWFAVLGSIVLRVYVLSEALTQTGIVDAVPLFFVVMVLSCTIACLLFAWAGLPAVMVYAAGLNLHLWF